MRRGYAAPPLCAGPVQETHPSESTDLLKNIIEPAIQRGYTPLPTDEEYRNI